MKQNPDSDLFEGAPDCPVEFLRWSKLATRRLIVGRVHLLAKMQRLCDETLRDGQFPPADVIRASAMSAAEISAIQKFADTGVKDIAGRDRTIVVDVGDAYPSTDPSDEEME